MKKVRLSALAALASLLLAFGCASTQLAFLDKSVPDSVKSKVLSDAGVAAYNDLLVRQGDLSQVKAVRDYFENALRFDPGNTTAQRYLALTNGFKAARLQEILKEAKALAAKSGRSEDETYRLCVLVQRAAAIDARDPDLARLQKDIDTARNALVAAYVAKAEAALAKKAKASDSATREALAVSAYVSLVKANTADPGNAKAKALLSQAKPEVDAIVEGNLKAVPGLIAAGSYTKARSRIDLVAGLSSKLGGSFDADVRKSYYELYYAWARYFFDKKDFAQAETKIAAALDSRKDAQAQSLRQQIQAQKDLAEQGTNFEEGIANVDALVKRGSLAQAMRILSALAVKTTDKGRLAQIEDRRKSIRGALADLYAKGVAAYQAERFDEAIDALDDIVGIDPGYQQAADYLEKARAKQQVLLGD
jgi:hypothetical protein